MNGSAEFVGRCARGKGLSMILETKKVSKTFGKIEALVDVDMAVEKGEIFGIAGPNGAGKSTLFNVISGSFPPSAGRIVFEGQDITKLNAHRICHLGLARTFQIPQTFPTLSVYDNVRVGATFGGHDGRGLGKRIKDNIEFLELSAFKETPASNLDLIYHQAGHDGSVSGYGLQASNARRTAGRVFHAGD